MQFIESICFKNGQYRLLEFHQQRVNSTFARFYSNSPFELAKILPALGIDDETYKARVCYSETTLDLEYALYVPRKIEQIQLVEVDPFDYSYKFSDRRIFNQLVKNSEADDVILTVDGMLTDASYANLAFWDGSDWLTPNTYLLNGVKRQYLLKQKKIRETSISTADVGSFEKVCLINAMLDLEELEVEMQSVSTQQ